MRVPSPVTLSLFKHSLPWYRHLLQKTFQLRSYDPLNSTLKTLNLYPSSFSFNSTVHQMAPLLPFTKRSIFTLSSLFALFLLRHHLWTGYHILSVYALWHPSERYVAITNWRDNFDITMLDYAIDQTTASVP